MWDASEFLDLVHIDIANTVGFNRLAAFVGEKREGDVVRFGKFCECFNWVVADGDDVDSGFFECFLIGLQLNQLPFAVWSPIGGSVEDEYGDAFFLK